MSDTFSGSVRISIPALTEPRIGFCNALNYVGGSLQISMDTFIKERLAKEAGLDDFEDFAPNIESANTKKSSSNCVEASISRMDWSFKPSGHEEDYLTRKPSAILQEAVVEVGKRPDKKKASHPTFLESMKRVKKKFRIHLGSQGDPRMNRAVQLRMNDPKLPLIDALIAGGFVFPDINNPEGKRSECKDADGVTVHQRRNQLIRRIRHAKKKEQDSSLEV